VTAEMLMAVLPSLQIPVPSVPVLTAVAVLAAASAPHAPADDTMLRFGHEGHSLRATAERTKRVIARWEIDGDGLWFDAAAWSTGTIPNNTPDQRFDVVIDRPVGSPYIVDFSGADATIASLALDATDATLRLLDNTLTVEEVVSVRAGTLELDGGSLAAESLAISAGQVVLRSGAVDITTSLTLSGGEFIFAGGILRNAALDAAESGFRFEGTGSKTLENATIANGLLSIGASEVRLAGGLRGNAGGGLAIAESGRLIIDGSQSITDTTVDVGVGTVDVRGDVSIERSTILLGPSQTDYPFGGGIGIGESATLRIDADSVVRGTGTFLATGSRTEPRLFLNEGLITTGPLSNGRIAISLDFGDFVNTGEIVADNGLILTGTRSFENQGLVRAVNDGRFIAEGNITGNGQMVADGGIIARRGPFTTAGLGNLRAINGGSVQIEGNWDNTGATVVLDASTGSWDLAGNLTGGVIELRDDASLRLFGAGVTIIGTEFKGNDFVVDSPTDLRLEDSPRFAESTLVVGPTANVTYRGDMVMSDELRVRIDGGALVADSGDAFGATLTVRDDYTLLANAGSIGAESVALDGRVELGALPDQFQFIPRFEIRGASVVNSGEIVDTADTEGTTLLFNAQETRNDGVIELLRGRGLMTRGLFTNANRIVLDGGAESRFVEPLRNEGTILLHSGALQIDTLENLGSIQVEGGALTLAGDRSSAALTGIAATGGDVFLEGTIDNTGRVFTLDASTGQWTISGLLQGGEVRAEDGLHLAVAAGSLADIRVIDTDIVVNRRGNDFDGLALFDGFSLVGGDLRIRENTELALFTNVGGSTISGGDIWIAGNSALDLFAARDLALDGFNIFTSADRSNASLLRIGDESTVTVTEGSVLGAGALSITGSRFETSRIVNNGLIDLLGDDLGLTAVSIGGDGEFRVGAGTNLSLFGVQFELNDGAFTGSMTFIGGSQTTSTAFPGNVPITRIANAVLISGRGTKTDLFADVTRNDGRMTITEGAVATIGGDRGVVENAGILEIDAGSSLLAFSGIHFLEGGALEIGLGLSATGSPEVGQVLSFTSADLGGALEVVLEDPLSLAIGERLQILVANGGINEVFEIMRLPTLANGNMLSVEYSGTAVDLVVVVPAPGGGGAALLIFIAGAGVRRRTSAA